MAIKLKYDPAADRMRLWVDQPEGDVLIFWLRRNQCLALLARLNDVAKDMGVALQEVEPLKAPPPRPRKDPAFDGVEPAVLEAVRVRREGEQAVVQLVSTGKGLGLKLNGTGVKRLQEMIATQAERAGWDPAVGVKRLRAMAKARAAIAQSQSRPAGPADT
jgi:hypothetical protein